MGQLGWHLLVALFSLAVGGGGWMFATDFGGYQVGCRFDQATYG